MVAALTLDLLEEFFDINAVDLAIAARRTERVHVLAVSRGINITKGMCSADDSHFDFLNVGLVELRSVSFSEVMFRVDLRIEKRLDARLEFCADVLVIGDLPKLILDLGNVLCDWIGRPDDLT